MMRRSIILAVCLVLAACAPERDASMAAIPARDTAPVTILGEVDDPAALQAYLVRMQDEDRPSYDEWPMVAVAARSIDGGPAHPRITLVYMAHRYWCGSGGCALQILTPGASSLEEMSSITISHAPVRVLQTRSNGMPDLSVGVRADYYPGDGRKFVALPFDGDRYAENPTMPPARLLPAGIEGEVVIPEEDVTAAFRLNAPPAA